MNILSNKLKNLPPKPGIYLFYNNKKELLYVGKATSLKNRVKSYFTGSSKSSRPIEELIHEVSNIKYIITDSVLEAIILEANYIKKYQPKYNVDNKDDKSWNYFGFTKDSYPRLIAIRQHELKNKRASYSNLFGPFPGLNTNEAIKIFRRLFSLSTCKPNSKKPCFYYQLNQCLGVCTNEISPIEYKQKVINPLITLLKGNKKRLISEIQKNMRLASKNQNFEEAARLRDQIKNLKKINDVSLLNKNLFDNDIKISPFARLEAYDISNLGPDQKVGSMVVFNPSGEVKSEYRKFKIKTVIGQSDVDCLKEILSRRFKNDWPLPDLILIDGGKPQLNAAKIILDQFELPIPLIAIAKGKTRKKNEIFPYKLNQKLARYIKSNQSLLINARDEAHRFAIQYQKKLRRIH